MQQQRPMVMVLLGVVAALMLGYFGYSKLIVGPIEAKRKEKERAEAAADKSLDQLNQAKIAAADVDELARLSLPGDTSLAVERYQVFLLDILKSSEIPTPSVTSGAPRRPFKTGDLSIIPFVVEAETDIWSFTKLLHAFYMAPRLHQITNLALTPVARKDIGPALRVSLTIEAVAIGEQTTSLRGAEIAFEPTVDLDREAYGGLVEKNVLYASSPGSTTLRANDPEHVVLTTVVHQGGSVEADLIDRAQEAARRVVRVGEELTVGRVRAVIVDLGINDMVLAIDGNLYLWRVGTPFSSRTLLSAEEALDREVRNRRRMQNMN